MNIRRDDKVVVLSGKDKGKEGRVLSADPKNGKVVVISGKDKGKEGKILVADPKAGKVIVSGVSVDSKHQKPRKQGEEGGIIKVETPIYACKVMLVCPKCGKPTRVGHAIVDGKKVRACKNCGATL